MEYSVFQIMWTLHSNGCARIARITAQGTKGRIGIVSFDGKNFHSEKKQGLVSDHFTKLDVINNFPGNLR